MVFMKALDNTSKWPLRNILEHLPNVSLADQNTCMMDGFRQTKLKDLCLQATLQEILDFQAEHVIELHPVLVQHADPHQTTQQSVTCETKQKNSWFVCIANKMAVVAHKNHCILYFWHSQSEFNTPSAS